MNNRVDATTSFVQQSIAGSLPAELLQWIVQLMLTLPPVRLRPTRSITVLALVCRHWNKSLRPLLWTSLSLHPSFLSKPSFVKWLSNITNTTSSWLLRSTRHFYVHHPPDSPQGHSDLLQLLTAIRNSRPGNDAPLLSLRLSGIRFPNNELDVIAPSASPSLLHLSLSNCILDAQSLHTNVIARLTLGSSSSLSTLCLDNVDSVDDSILLEIIHNCHSIKSLSIAECQSVTDLSVKTAIELWPCLTWLNISGTSITLTSMRCLAERESSRVADWDANKASTPSGNCQFSHLTHLAIANCSFPKAVTRLLAQYLSSLTFLQSLDVSHTSSGWPALASAMIPDTHARPLLVSEQMLQQYTSQLSNLRSLSSEDHTLDNGHNLFGLMNGNEQDQTSIQSELQSDANQAQSLKDSSFYRHLPTRFTMLKQLRIGWHGLLLEQDCRLMFSRMHALTHLWIADIVSLSPRALQNILVRCPLLTHLHLPSLPRNQSPSAILLHPSDLIALIPSKATQLEWVSMVGHCVTADVLRSIGLGCRRLVGIDISMTRSYLQLPRVGSGGMGSSTEHLTTAIIGEFVEMVVGLQVMRCAGLGLSAKDMRLLSQRYPHVSFEDCLASTPVDWIEMN
ncbi:hypothetical protein BATDEDRAFT_88388 [Batrachochytrium dendrobatidis JAM81]|uniref:F-box domain-containing protein n=1 Tax=Batrachochytrium dendrobatidis (strain JAM81 / FGSC 10211) TaxID=684364 RepID=F4P191_BATDJ|nr:uncharacterized protein BATDEDRAFT_88388 [Batrachochytrium dendrobatidis JAM81]EGF80705.1 hypothetical protein BATDEDRAFT_88388 [Batrachochytrium dendrobatidis JAM81]|eukprot:XP_006678661.1 hypothetical protein BATDEDRAFT_88388 [Batrachochytrium dendrobatidis JAM81]